MVLSGIAVLRSMLTMAIPDVEISAVRFNRLFAIWF